MFRLVIIIILVALVATSCAIRRVGTPPPPEEEPAAGGEPFEPLATAGDREIVPEVYPVRVEVVPDSGDSMVPPGDMSYLAFDSVSSETDPREVYRLQIFTSRLYAEANRERELAEEIFNLPVYLDYEVPYYKLRVGDFVNREEAESMLGEIKAIGYRNAWVARVILRIREVPEPEFTDEPALPEGLRDSMLVVPDTTIEGDAGEDD